MANTTGLTAGLASASAQTRAFGQRAQATGGMLTKGLSLPIALVGAASVKMALDFEKSMTDIAALTGASQKTIEQYKEAVLDMAPKTGQGPKELGDALYFIVSSGFKGAAALRVLEASARASAAGLGETATIADAVTSAVNAYGEEALSATLATDIMLAAVREGKNEPAELAMSIGRVIAPAQAMGIEFSEVAAQMASMSMVGIDASESATALRGIMMSLLKPTSDAADAFAAVGTSAAGIREAVSRDGLLNTLIDLQERIKKQGLDPNTTLASMFPNVRALNGVIIDLGKNQAKNVEITKELAKAAGDTDEAFARASESAGFKMQQAMAALKVAAIQIGDVLLPPLVAIVGQVAKLAQAFSDLPAPVQEAAVYLALAAAAAGPLLMMLPGIATALGAISGVAAGAASMLGAFAAAFSVEGIAGLATAISAAMGPVGWIILAVVALGAAFLAAYKYIEPFRNAVTAVGGAIVRAWRSVVSAVRTASVQVKKAIGEAAAYIGKTFAPAMEEVKKTVRQNLAIVAQFWHAHGAEIKASIAAMYRAGLPIVKAVFKTMVAVVKGGLNIIAGAIRVIAAVMRGDWSAAWKGLGQVARGGVMVLAAIVRGIPSLLGAIFKGAGQLLLSAGRAIIQGLIDGIKGKLGDLYGTVGGIAGRIRDLKGPLAKDATLLRPAGQAIIGGLMAGISDQLGPLYSLVGGIGPQLSVSAAPRVAFAGASGGSVVGGPPQLAAARSGDVYDMRGSVFADDFDTVIAAANKRGTAKVTRRNMRTKGIGR
jgi:TP901 family phage tail tape measure protein